MKWLFIGLGTSLAIAAIAGAVAAVCRRNPIQNTDNVDGGVVKRYWADAPKNIESTEITEFHCVISLIASDDTDSLGNRVYTLDAVLDNGKVLVKYDWYQRQGDCDKAEYTVDPDFLVHLQEIVAEYNFAQYNGYYHSVSGLPNMYGEKLNILYSGGEQIYVHDNQSGFLPHEAVKELILLFGAATKMDNK